MRLEFVTAQLQAAYMDRENLRRDKEALFNQLQTVEERQGLNELQIRTLKVLISQPDGVEIKAYTRPPCETQFFYASNPTAQNKETKPTPPPTKKKATKKR